METSEVPKSMRYSRHTVDYSLHRESVANMIFKPISKMTRYKVNISKPTRSLVEPHDRSFRQEDINLFIMKSDKKDFDVRLDDFFDGDEAHNVPVKTLPAVRRVGGLSVTSEGFINENKWWGKLFWKKRESAETPQQLRRSERPSWVARLQKMSFQKKKVKEPQYASSSKDVFSFFGEFASNSNRVGVGFNFTRKIFGYHPIKQKNYNRPFFTIYVTLLQLMLFIGIIVTHGIAPIGLAFKTMTEPVLMPDMNTRLVIGYELQNFWIGPRQADMIRLGAKYSPCIKPDKWYDTMAASLRTSVDASGCCIFSDGSGCIQNEFKFCSPVVATWHAGKVCGQDPNYCSDDVDWKSLSIVDWPVSIPSFPLEFQMIKSFFILITSVGRPCCVGLLGECIMTTREYCLFKKGIFHQDANLCSQVSCIDEICGMTRSSEKGKPKQFYRFITSLFIIPGLLALVITLVFQTVVMCDIEKITGTLEMSIVYLTCGAGGSMLSCTFIPYYVEAGPAGSQCGVLAILIIEIARWNIQERPKVQFLTCIIFIIVLFVVGLVVPQVDNWAHLGGLVLGLFLAIVFRPIRQVTGNAIHPYFINFQRILGAVVSSLLFSVLIYLYYFMEPIKCDFCVYFNCLPFSDDYCEGMSLNLVYNSILLNRDEW